MERTRRRTSKPTWITIISGFSKGIDVGPARAHPWIPSLFLLALVSGCGVIFNASQSDPSSSGDATGDATGSGDSTGGETGPVGGRDPDDADDSADSPSLSRVTIDLTESSAPVELTSSSDIVRTNTVGATVDSTSSIEAGTNYREGSVVLSVDADELSGRLVTLQARRVNSLINGDFESSVASSDADSLGGWQYPGLVGGISSGTITTGAAASVGTDNAATITEGASTGNFYIQQSFPISPGEIFRVRFKADASAILPAFVQDGVYNDGHIEVRFRTTTAAGGAAVSLKIPSYSNVVPTGTTLSTTATNYERLNVLTSSSALAQSLLYVTPDCDQHVIYEAGTLNYSQNMTFQRVNPGASACRDVVKYGQLVFVFTSGTTAGSHFEIDDIIVDWERQIETEVIDLDTLEVLQRSTLESFRVDPIDSTAHPSVGLRVHLRSLDSADGRSPILEAIHFESGNPLQLTVEGNPTPLFDRARLGLDIHIAPKSEFNDETMAMQTECREPWTAGEYSNCYELFGKYNLSRPRIDVPVAGFDFTVSGTDYAPTLNSYGRAYLKRIREANDSGLDPLILLNIAGDVSTLWNGACALTPSRPASGIWSTASDGDLSKHLIEVYAKAAAENLDGTTEIGAFATEFEIFNEPNLSSFAPACTAHVSSEDALPLTDVLASAIRGVRSDAQISLSGLASNGQVFDASYFVSTLLPDVAPDNFDHSSFHPYVDAYRPEVIGDRWTSAKSILSGGGWDPVAKTAHLGEFGFSLAEYDPQCANGGSYQWGRGWGPAAHGNRMAIATIEGLATESESVIAWGRMNNESESSEPTCWRSLGGYKSLFIRDAGSGFLDTGDHDDITQYTPNPGGEAFLTIGKFLSYSNPTPEPAMEPVSLPTVDGKDESTAHYHSQFFRTDFGWALALWFYRDYEFGLIDASVEEQTDVYYQNFLYGAREHGASIASAGDPVQDYGFEGKRLHDVVIATGADQLLGGIQGDVRVAGQATKGATIVDLETGEETTVPIFEEGATWRIRDVVIGERPTLILLRTHANLERPYENLSIWADPDPASYNSWFRVNRDSGSAPPASIPATGNTFVQGRKSPLLPDGVYLSGTSNPYFDYRGGEATSPEGDPDQAVPTYNACPGVPEADYGICIQP